MTDEATPEQRADFQRRYLAVKLEFMASEMKATGRSFSDLLIDVASQDIHGIATAITFGVTSAEAVLTLLQTDVANLVLARLKENVAKVVANPDAPLPTTAEDEAIGDELEALRRSFEGDGK